MTRFLNASEKTFTSLDPFPRQITVGANTMHRHLARGASLSARLLMATALIAVSEYFCYRTAYNMPELLGETAREFFLRFCAFIYFAFSGTASAAPRPNGKD